MILTKRANIKAFTIFELLITMLITSLLITLVISMFFRFNEFFMLRKKQWEDNTEVLRFIMTLGDDIDKSEKVSYSEQSLVIGDKENISTTYVFNDWEILRIYGHETDTFKVQFKIHNDSGLKGNLNITDKILLDSTNPAKLDFSIDFRKIYGNRIKFMYFKELGLSLD